MHGVMLVALVAGASGLGAQSCAPTACAHSCFHAKANSHDSTVPSRAWAPSVGGSVRERDANAASSVICDRGRSR